MVGYVAILMHASVQNCNLWDAHCYKNSKTVMIILSRDKGGTMGWHDWLSGLEAVS